MQPAGEPFYAGQWVLHVWNACLSERYDFLIDHIENVEADLTQAALRL